MKEIKTENIIIRATKKEKKNLKNRAKKVGLKMSPFAHNKLFKGEKV